MCLKANGHLLQMYSKEYIKDGTVVPVSGAPQPVSWQSSEGQSYSIQYTHTSVPRCSPPRTHPLVHTRPQTSDREDQEPPRFYIRAEDGSKVKENVHVLISF